MLPSKQNLPKDKDTEKREIENNEKKLKKERLKRKGV